MAPQQQQHNRPDPVLVALARLQDKVDGIASTQAQHARKIQWITTAAVLVVGAVGGPDAVAALTGGPV